MFSNEVALKNYNRRNANNYGRLEQTANPNYEYNYEEKLNKKLSKYLKIDNTLADLEPPDLSMSNNFYANNYEFITP
jgi:hypothetical protein